MWGRERWKRFRGYRDCPKIVNIVLRKERRLCYKQKRLQCMAANTSGGDSVVWPTVFALM
ncbi:hypothetical protein ACH5RR_027402, partial [Cinchona calisaya]